MKKQTKGIRMPIDLIEQIEKFMKENYMTTFSSAVIELIRLGIEASKKD